jgi:RNA polymerase sigma-70 factor (ECF subfamily)
MTADTRQVRFETLFRSHVDGVRRYVARRAADGVEDIVAETFTVAWRRLDDRPADAFPWLLAIARRVLANQRRSDARRGALADRIARLEPPPAVVDEEDPRGPAVLEALARLSEPDREVLLLVECDGITRQQAAVVLGVSRAQVRVRLHRARRRFIASYQSEPGSPAGSIAEGAPHVAC